MKTTPNARSQALDASAAVGGSPASPWWTEEYGFFGSFYLEGDDSLEGYLGSRSQTLDERTTTEVLGVMKLLGLKGAQRLMDVPCGYGRHSIGLARQGLSVVGVDLNSTFLDLAKARARAAGVAVQFARANMLHLDYDGEYDAVINMFYSFGFFDSDAENLEVIRRFYKALKPGGSFLMHTDVSVPKLLARASQEGEEVRDLQSGKTLRIVDSYDPETKRINGAWILNDGSETRRDYSVRVYDNAEFSSLCREVGFSSVSSYGYWDGQPYTEASENMIVVARK